MKYQSSDNKHNLTVSVFELTKENDLTRDPSGSPYDQIQTGEVRSRGIELELETKPLETLSVVFNATRIDMEVTKDNNGLKGKTPIWVADRTASVWVDYGFQEGGMSGANVGVGIRYVGETEMDALNTDEVPAFTLVDLALSYDLGTVTKSLHGISTRLTANNLFNKRYASCYDGNNCWFGAERTLEASLKWEY